MSLPEQEKYEIDKALQSWRQGDISLDAGLEFLHLADLSKPHSDASIKIAQTLTHNKGNVNVGHAVVLQQIPGLVVLNQTCDIIRDCRKRPFVQVAPLFEVVSHWVEEVRRHKRPAFAYVPAVADKNLVADLDRTMTVEKSVIAGLTRTSGCRTDDERRHFTLALARNRSRFAFPDDFVKATRRFQRRLVEKFNSQTSEGAHLRMLKQIRVCAKPSWDHDEVQLDWWFIKENDPLGVQANWSEYLDQWLDRLDLGGRFRLNPATVCCLEDMTASDYLKSDLLDFDRLSVT